MEEPLALHPVKLYVYDLSKGMARRLSPLMLGKSTAGAAASRGLAFRHRPPDTGAGVAVCCPGGGDLRPVSLSRGSGPPRKAP